MIAIVPYTTTLDRRGRPYRFLDLPAHREGEPLRWHACEVVGDHAIVWSDDPLPGEALPDDPVATRFGDLSVSERTRVRQAARALGLTAQDVADMAGDGERVAWLLVLLAQRRRRRRVDENGGIVFDGPIEPQRRPLPWQAAGGANPAVPVIVDDSATISLNSGDWGSPAYPGSTYLRCSGIGAGFDTGGGGYGDSYYNTAIGPDCAAGFRVHTGVVGESGDTEANVYLRMANPSADFNALDGYGFHTVAVSGTDLWRINEWVNGSPTNLFGDILAAAEFTADDEMEARAYGSTLELWYKPSGGSWAIKVSGTDATYTNAGKPVFESDQHKIDDLRAGNLVWHFGSGTADSTTAYDTDITPAYPASTAADDIAILVANVTCDGTSVTPPTFGPDPTDWTQLANTTSVNGAGTQGVRLGVWWKRLTGGDAEPAVQMNDDGVGDTSAQIIAQIEVLRGAPDSGTPFDAIVTSTGEGTSPSLTGVTTSDYGLLVAGIASGGAVTHSGWTATDPATLTERFDVSA